MDIESDKAARILKSFCKDGFYQEEERPTGDGPKAKQKVLKKIPSEVRRIWFPITCESTWREIPHVGAQTG